mmetsp:Transcript_29592/g.74437  ORF Transcript_29592/g.74437 Transcript_29592/m.74437 type:complete len:407 (+) Transcript_29592:72-1292(+)
MGSTEISIPADAAEDGAKREALRKAGLDFFEQVLAEASTGKDPFAPEAARPEKAAVARAGDARPGTTRRARAQREDPDLEAVGAMISGARLYVLTAVFVACSAAGLVLFKACLNPLETPGILTFLHLLPLSLLLLAFSGALGLEPITLDGAKASLPTCALNMFQMMMLFSVLLEGSVLFTISFCAVSQHAFQVAAEAALSRSAPPARSTWLCAAGLAALGAEVAGEVLFLRRPLPPFRTLLALLGYSGARLAQVAWEAAVASPARLEALLGGAEAAAKVAAAAEAQAGMRHADLALYSSLLGSLMALCLGFIGMEGNELIEHELSVPAVTAIMVSLACFIAAAVSDVLLTPMSTPRLRTGLLGLAAVGTILIDTAGPGAQRHVVTIGGALLATSVSALGSFLHNMA